MKLGAIHKYRFTGEHWDYTTEVDPVMGRQDTYYLKESIRFALVPSDRGQMSLFSTKQLRYNAQIRNLRDAAGNLVFTDALTGEPAISYVGVSEPVFDVYGVLMGYRHDLAQGV